MRMLLVGVLGLSTVGCTSYAPDAGHEVVLVEKPWFLGHGGVVSDPVTTGRAWTAITTDGVRKHDMNQVAINPTAVGDIDTEVRSGLESFFHSQQLPVQILTMTVGRAIPPDAIKDQRIQTAAQEQRIQTEKQVTLAEEQRALAEAARAKADNAYRQAIGLTPQEFIELQRINMQGQVCGQQGRATCTFIQNGTATPVMDVRAR